MARELDQSISKTAALVGWSQSAVVCIYQKWSKEGTAVNYWQDHGWPRLIDARGEWRLVRMVRSNRRDIVAQIAEEVKAVVCDYVFSYLQKLSLWSDSRIRSTVTISSQCVHPVTTIWFARIYLSEINKTNQSQGECLRSVNHARAYTAGSPPPSSNVYSTVPLPRAGAVPTLTCSDMFNLKLRNTLVRQQSRKMPHHSPCQREEIVRLKKKSSAKRNNWVKEKTRIKIWTSFQRWRELQDL